MRVDNGKNWWVVLILVGSLVLFILLGGRETSPVVVHEGQCFAISVTNLDDEGDGGVRVYYKAQEGLWLPMRNGVMYQTLDTFSLPTGFVATLEVDAQLKERGIMLWPFLPQGWERYHISSPYGSMVVDVGPCPQ